MSEAELRRKEIDSFNDHQKDNRNRATQLANYAFLLAGGSFTASVTIFASRPKEQITNTIVHFLHNGWYNLFIAMVSFFTMILVIVLRDYFIAEINWRPILDDREPYLKSKKYVGCYIVFEVIILAAGLFGFGTLIYGLYMIMEAASTLVS